MLSCSFFLFTGWNTVKHQNQSINQLINQSISQSINQSLNQSINQYLSISVTRKARKTIFPTEIGLCQWCGINHIYWILMPSPCLELDIDSLEDLICHKFRVSTLIRKLENQREQYHLRNITSRRQMHKWFPNVFTNFSWIYSLNREASGYFQTSIIYINIIWL